MKKSVLVIFSEDLSEKNKIKWGQFNTLVAPERFEVIAKKYDLVFKNINEFVDTGSIYEASTFAEELSLQILPDGSRISKVFMYKGYELWWMHYNSLFLYFCLPYTQYKKLLEYIRNFHSVYLYQPPYKSLFSCYLQAYECEFNLIRKKGVRSPAILPFGVFLQIILTLISIPFLMINKCHLMIFIGDKFDKSKDYDFRMKFIYEELRRRGLPFIEFIRSLEPWRNVLQHVFVRRRPVVYSEGVAFVGRFISIVTGGHRKGKQKFGTHTFVSQTDPDVRFKLLVATQYLISGYDDVWAIRIMKLILRMIGVRAVYITAVLERNFHAFLGCKLLNIPVIGIQHGAAPKDYFVSDFMCKFDGEKQLSVDKYGLWSEWWKEYYIKNSKAYSKDQLFVSGPMRPQKHRDVLIARRLQKKNSSIKVLFVPGQISAPKEVMPYLLALMETEGVSVYLTFRPYRDAFEKKLRESNPGIIEKFGKEKILRGSIQDAISECDIVVGSNSTAVLEALLQLKPLVFFDTKKWGDYFEMKSFESSYKFFAENPAELVKYIKENVDMSEDVLKKLQEKFFGDPYKNGSEWVVDQLKSVP
ncbi:hypothetical protein HOE22_02470 [Candidatus Woesearchaeota archaeon]|jgi:hypothetical protein|nr:hypothetical protein [Candidatus Woesearchaeota archaeon]MBT6048127.1 hypothetical protein [Candidatus Scalindua sp.]